MPDIGATVEPKTREVFARLILSPLAVTAIVALIYAGFLLERLHRHRFDFSVFVCAGDAHCDPSAVPCNLTVYPSSEGYDGQFYYRLALDPFSSRDPHHGIELDAPSYRAQRILYPLAVWLLSFGGRTGLVPAWMVLVNYFGVCAIAWLAALYFRSIGRAALWALGVALYGGLVLALYRDLTEIMAVMLMLAAIVLLQRKRRLTAAILLGLSVLTRETVLLFAAACAGVILWEATKRRRLTVHPVVVLIPIATFAGWRTIVWLLWGPVGRVNLSGAFRIPLSPLFGCLWRRMLVFDGSQTLWFLEAGALVAVAAAALWCLRGSKAGHAEKTGLILYVLLIFSLPRDIWAEGWSFLRISAELHTLAIMVLVGSASRWRIPVVAATSMMGVFLMIHHAWANII